MVSYFNKFLTEGDFLQPSGSSPYVFYAAFILRGALPTADPIIITNVSDDVRFYSALWLYNLICTEFYDQRPLCCLVYKIFGTLGGNKLLTGVNQRTWSWWRHQMETFFRVILVLCAGNSPITGEFPSQRPVTRSLGVFFDLRLNKGLSKQSRRRCFETPSRSLWRHCNDMWGNSRWGISQSENGMRYVGHCLEYFPNCLAYMSAVTWVKSKTSGW